MFCQRLILPVLWLLTLQIVCQARIGETRIECIERYGPEIKKGGSAFKIPTANWGRYQSGKILLDFAFVEMEAVAVSYTSTAVMLSVPDSLKILAAEGTDWQPFIPAEPMRSHCKKLPQVYLRSKEGLIAEMLPVYCVGVVIYTEWAFNRVYGQPLARKELDSSL